MIPDRLILEELASRGWEELKEYFPDDSRSTIRNWLSKYEIKVNTKYRQVSQEEINFINSVITPKDPKEFYEAYLQWYKNGSSTRSPKSFRSLVNRYWVYEFEDIPLKRLCRDKDICELLKWEFILVKFCDDYKKGDLTKIKAYALESFLYKKLEKKLNNFLKLREKMELFYPCEKDYKKVLLSLRKYLELTNRRIKRFINKNYGEPV